MSTRRLADVCEVIMGQAPTGDSYNDTGQGVALVAGAGDIKAGRIVPTKFTTAPTKLSQPDDVIIGIRASIGMRAISPSVVCLGRGVAALRCGPKLDHRYLWHWIGSAAPQLASKGRGATFLQVNRDDVSEMLIPVPSLQEQRRVVRILDAVDALCEKRQKTLGLLDRMTSSVFTSRFGDPITNPRGWPITTLGDLGDLERGVSKHRPRNAPHLLGGAYPLIQTGDVARSGGVITDYTSTYSEAGLSQSRLWPAGTLCITIAANIAMAGVVTFDACFPDSVVGFTADPAVTTYVQAWLSFLQPTLERSAPESAQKNINLAILRRLPVPTPPRPAMSDFAGVVSEIRRARRRHAKGLVGLEVLRDALLARAFVGTV